MQTASVSTNHLDRRLDQQSPGRQRARGTYRIGGAAGLVFAASVVVQNVLRSGAPKPDAKAAEVARYVAGHQGIDNMLFALAVVGMFALLTFGGAVYRRIGDGPGATWARTGFLGVAGVAASFSAMLVTQLALAVSVDRGTTLSTVDTLWVLHNAAFAFLLCTLGAALLGMSLGSAADGLVSRRFRVAGPIGALLLAAAALPTMATAQGGPTMALGIVGFGIWVVWVVSAGISLLRLED